MTRLTRLISQGLLGLATVLACLAVWEWAAEVFDRRLLVLLGYSPLRLFEVAAVALLFVIAVELWDIKRVIGAPRS